MVNQIPYALGLLAILPGVDGHAYQLVPPARNYVNQAGGCPHCGQAGGPKNVKAKGNGVWPTHHAYGSHGLCGDPFQNTPETSFEKEPYFSNPTPPQATYTAGDIVDFEIGISTHHEGHYSFRLCEKVLSPANFKNHKEAQDCLDEHVLERAGPDAYGDCKPNDSRQDCQPLDPNHPGRFYTTIAYSGSFKMKYKIPAGVSCDHCTIQWHWATGNTCIYDESYFNYFKNVMPAAGWESTPFTRFAGASWANMGNAGCGPGGKNGGGEFGEEFWNCVDVKILKGDGSQPQPRPRPRPSPVPQPRPSPRPRPTPAPTPPDRAGCEGWCVHPPLPWVQKCGWVYCRECNECGSIGECADWCSDAPVTVGEKCDWIYCRGCKDCPLQMDMPEH